MKNTKIMVFGLFVLVVLISQTASAGNYPDATILKLSVTGGGRVGETLTMWVHVKNTGTETLGANSHMSFVFTKTFDDNFGDNNNIALTSQGGDYVNGKWTAQSGPLKPGQTRWYSAKFTPKHARAYRFASSIDRTTNGITYVNDAKYIYFTVSEKVKISKLASVTTVRAHTGVNLIATVSNVGIKTISDCQVIFSVKGPHVNGIVGRTRCGETGTNTYMLRYVPATMGTYYYYAKVSSNGRSITDWSAPKSFYIANPI
jgi:hypothetical protein